jgi:Family of unknown function (DUF6345)
MKTIKRKIIAAAALFIFAMFHGQAQTNIIIKSPVIAADRTAKISWNAQTGAVYQVWAADSLTAIGNQGLKWIVRDADCVSKGTNAEWMDVGNPQQIPRLLPPRFQPMRFYRVEKVKQATLTPSPTVALSLSQTNPISGDLYASVSVTLVDTNQQLSVVNVFVDGQKLYSLPNQSFTVFINSCEWPNGAHEIYAVATAVDTGETLPDSDAATETNSANFAVGVSSSKFVTFSNYISQFFVAVPFFAAGQTQEVVATFAEDSCWRLTVLNYQDTPVRQFTGQNSSLYAAWNGNDDSGNPLPYGFYDYYIEARPSRFGCLSGMSSMAPSSASKIVSPNKATTEISSGAEGKVMMTPAAMQFDRSSSGVVENIKIPSLNPAPPAIEAQSRAVATFEETPMVVSYNGKNKLINGVPAILYPPAPTARELSSKGVTAAKSSGGSKLVDSPQNSDFPDMVYTTRTPNRIPGNLFFGFAGTVGIGYQGHHPKSGSFGLPPGGVVSLSHPPYGPLKNASTIANGFSINMGFAGWRTSFLLGDDDFNSADLFPILGTGTGTGTFASQCNFGLLVGHMTAAAHIDNDYFTTHSYYPVYNTAQPGAYQWIPFPGMDFGNPSGTSKLRWMALYGCDSIREQDYNDLWTKFLIPMPPNVRLLLGSEEGVFIHPSFGYRFAASLNGWTTQDGAPMTIFNAWCDAAAYADQQTAKSLRYRIFGLGTRHMTAIYRDDSQEGSWRTIGDSIWNWGTDISYDWYDVSFVSQQVYP